MAICFSAHYFRHPEATGTGVSFISQIQEFHHDPGLLGPGNIVQDIAILKGMSAVRCRRARNLLVDLTSDVPGVTVTVFALQQDRRPRLDWELSQLYAMLCYAAFQYGPVRPVSFDRLVVQPIYKFVQYYKFGLRPPAEAFGQMPPAISQAMDWMTWYQHSGLLPSYWPWVAPDGVMYWWDTSVDLSAAQQAQAGPASDAQPTASDQGADEQRYQNISKRRGRRGRGRRRSTPPEEQPPYEHVGKPAERPLALELHKDLPEALRPVVADAAKDIPERLKSWPSHGIFSRPITYSKTVPLYVDDFQFRMYTAKYHMNGLAAGQRLSSLTAPLYLALRNVTHVVLNTQELEAHTELGDLHEYLQEAFMDAQGPGLQLYVTVYCARPLEDRVGEDLWFALLKNNTSRFAPGQKGTVQDLVRQTCATVVSGVFRE